MSNLALELRYAARQLRRNPGFTVTMLVTLGLAIGANTAIFSLVNALMLRSLPYRQPERLGAIFQRTEGTVSGEEPRWIDGEQWEQLRDSVPAVLPAVSSGLASGVNLETAGEAQYVHDGRVSARYFDVLGIRPALGRTFSEGEDRPHGPPAAILSYHLWHTACGRRWRMWRARVCGHRLRD